MGLSMHGFKNTLCNAFFFFLNKQLKENILFVLRLLKHDSTSVKNACKLLTRRDLAATVGDETKCGWEINLCLAGSKSLKISRGLPRWWFRLIHEASNNECDIIENHIGEILFFLVSRLSNLTATPRHAYWL